MTAGLGVSHETSPEGAPRPAPPKSGEVLLIDEAASVQFAGDRRLVLRVSRVDSRETYEGWVWLTGYVLDQRGDATEQREIFVQLAGLKRTGAPVAQQRRPKGRS